MSLFLLLSTRRSYFQKRYQRSRDVYISFSRRLHFSFILSWLCTLVEWIFVKCTLPFYLSLFLPLSISISISISTYLPIYLSTYQSIYLSTSFIRYDTNSKYSQLKCTHRLVDGYHGKQKKKHTKRKETEVLYFFYPILFLFFFTLFKRNISRSIVMQENIEKVNTSETIEINLRRRAYKSRYINSGGTLCQWKNLK